MNKIEELLQQLCPNGVEFKELGEVYEFKYGTGNTIPTIGGKYPVYGSNGIVGTHNEYNSEDTPVIGHIGAYAGIVNWAKGKHFVTYNGVICKLKSEQVLPQYAYYQLLMQDFLSMAHSGSQPFVSYGMLNKVTIPIPPLPIQQEIVSILDKFTQLEAELEAELEARRTQYNFYRNQLLDFEGKEVEWKELQDVTNYSKSRISATGVDNTSYVGVDNLLQNKQGKTFSSYVPKIGNLTRYEIGDILIGNIRPYLKKIWRATNTGGTNGDVLVICIQMENKNKLNSKFLFYLLSSDMFFDYNMQFAKGAKMPRGDKSSIMKFKIPIPPMSEQERIVEILDKFDALVNDLSVGLPAEIAARRKQYEHYRSRLLDFKSVPNG